MGAYIIVRQLGRAGPSLAEKAETHGWHACVCVCLDFYLNPCSHRLCAFIHPTDRTSGRAGPTVLRYDCRSRRGRSRIRPRLRRTHVGTPPGLCSQTPRPPILMHPTAERLAAHGSGMGSGADDDATTAVIVVRFWCLAFGCMGVALALAPASIIIGLASLYFTFSTRKRGKGPFS